MEVKNVLSLENPSFCWYLICSCLLVLKMQFVVLLTVFHRMRSKVFISSEDAAWRNGDMDKTDENVDRVRRAHLNDMENILPFLVISLGYLFVNAPDWLTILLLILFLVARVLHTIVYAVYVVRQPTRAICFVIGFSIMAYMSVHVAIYAFKEVVTK